MLRDLYLDWMLSKKKPFIGSSMMDREGLADENRLRLVGVVSARDLLRLRAGAAISLTANASDADGTLQRVQFFAGSTSLGTDTTAPYTATWNNAASRSR